MSTESTTTDAPHRDPDWLRRMALDERISYAEMADRAGVTRHTIRKWIDKHDLQSEFRIAYVCYELNVPEDEHDYAHRIDEFADERDLWLGVTMDVRVGACVFGAAGYMTPAITLNAVRRLVTHQRGVVSNDDIIGAIERILKESDDLPPVNPPAHDE